MIKAIIFVAFLFLAGCSGNCSGNGGDPGTEIDPKLYQECMRATPPAAFDNVGGTQTVVEACERISQIRIDQ